MKIFVLNRQRKYFIDIGDCEGIVSKFVDQYLPQYKDYDMLELYISFVSKARITQLKDELFGAKVATDIIAVSFDISNINKKIPSVFGEIFICPHVAKIQSLEYNNSFRNEIALLIIHGLLHLIGFDDTTDAGKTRMRKEERKMLNKCGFK